MLLSDYDDSSSSSESQQPDDDIPLTDRLMDGRETVSKEVETKKRILPDACDVFNEINRPSFLTPEANKKSKTCAAHVTRTPAPQATAAEQVQQRAEQADITKMAPRLKGQPDTAAVLSAPAQRSTAPASEKKSLIGNDALIAMMGGGGHVDQKNSKPTHATTVQDALAEPSAAQLPRQKQERKNKEKSKRVMGQSSHSHWKSEAEMVLRQQFDS